MICGKHFDNKYIKEGKKCKLRWELQPIPTINSDSSLCVVPCIPRKPPKEHNICNDEWNEFKANDVIHNLNSISPDICPKDFTFLKQKTFVLMYQLIIDEITKIPVIHGSIMVDGNLHISLSYLGYHVPRVVSFCPWLSIVKKSALENIPQYLRSKGVEMNPILKELNDIQHYKPQGRPPYSSQLIRYAILLRYTSYQSYKILLEQFSLPSLSLIKKLQQGKVDALKSAEIPIKNGSISSECVLMVDEMYLKKAAQYHCGNYIREDSSGELY